MANYKIETYEIKSLSKDYILGNYRQKYDHISTAESIYNNFIKFIPRGNHIGRYEPLK